MVKMRSRFLLALLLFALLTIAPAVLGFGPPSVVDSSSEVGASYPFVASQIAAAQRATPPAIGARASIVIDTATGRQLAGGHERDRLPIASTTKIMTALLAIERGRLDQVVTASVTAADLPGSSVMGLRSGERLTLEDLLYGMMLPSGNDAALTVARAIAGSDTAFVALMNRRAAELGLADTHFANPHGLDAPDHYSSATDLASLARVALANPTFARIVATRQKTVVGLASKASYDLTNTNPLLARTDAEGIKTGHTDAAGACLVGAFLRDGHRIITVVLNSPDYTADSVALADYAYSASVWQIIESPASPFDRAPGATRPRFRDSSTIVLPAWQVPYLSVEVLPAGDTVRVSVAGRERAVFTLAN